jgi:hypothetical protein
VAQISAYRLADRDRLSVGDRSDKLQLRR